MPPTSTWSSGYRWANSDRTCWVWLSSKDRWEGTVITDNNDNKSTVIPQRNQNPNILGQWYRSCLFHQQILPPSPLYPSSPDGFYPPPPPPPLDFTTFPEDLNPPQGDFIPQRNVPPLPVDFITPVVADINHTVCQYRMTSSVHP